MAVVSPPETGRGRAGRRYPDPVLCRSELGQDSELSPPAHTELSQLSQWALRNTAADAMFLFPDAKQGLDPGIFRARTLRAVYVDWKVGARLTTSKNSA